jgi:enterobactin synthetase component D
MGFFDSIHERGIAIEFLVIPAFFSESEVSESLRSASWKRRCEFAAGRLAARKALASFGVAAEVIPRSDSGAPVWPPGRVGSISHSATHACAVAAHTDSYIGLGIDIEPHSSMNRLVSLRNIFLTEAENSLSPLEAFISFSAKEALFKMIFPLAKQFFGFESAVVKDIDSRAVTLTLKESIGSFSRGSCFQAFFGFHQNHVVTLCMHA